MAQEQLDAVVRHIQGLVDSETAGQRADRELLHAFSVRNDEAAFAALVRRHGPMVLGVCRQVLGHEQDAEDAFQATFFILARNAVSIRKKEAVASWLHGVAYYTAMKAKTSAARRRAHEARAKAPPQRDPSREAAWHEVQAAVNEEIQRLPGRYRDPFVLCFLEGQSRAEAARELGLKEGTVWSRLAEARRRLQEQLARRGVALPAGLCVVGLDRAAVTAAMPALLIRCTTKAALSFAAGKAVAADLASAEAAAFAKGALKSMGVAKLKFTTGLLLALGLCGTAAGTLIYQAPAGDELAPQRSATVKTGDAPQQGEPQKLNKEEQEKALADFAQRYALRPEEILKRIPPPFPPSRLVYHRQHYPKDEKADDMMFLHWRDGLRFVGTIGGIKTDPRKVQLLFLLENLPALLGDFSLGSKLDVQGDDDLLYAAADGDFVFREHVPLQQIVEKLAETLRGECHLPIHLTLHDEENSVYVARGKYNFLPTPGRNQDELDFYVTRRTAGHSDYCGGGDFDIMLRCLSRYIGKRVVSDVKDPPSLVRFRSHDVCSQKPGDVEAVLKHLSEQTGLTFTEEKRRTPVLLVKRESQAPRRPSPLPSADRELDTDDDGLSDFQEIHKYFSDPHKKATAGKGVSDGDWNERRQFTYSIRSVIRVMPPYNLQALNDDYQDVRVRKETKEFVELEVISYPLNTNAEAITENRNWKKDYAGMKEYLKAGVTTNWDAAMQKDLLGELAKNGIDPDKLTDKELVEKVSGWLLSRCRYMSMAFGTMYADFLDKKPIILPGLEKAFHREKGDPNWTVEEEFDHELFGKGMFYSRTRGSCTSSAVLLATVLRALGIPTRIIVTIPIVDANDGEQVALVRKNIRHHQVRAKISDGLVRAGQGFANHTYNEVFVGNRWRRLNYNKLGQNILDEQYFGLMIKVHTFNDLSEAGLAPTWGRRYALSLRDDNFKTSNPYRTLEISDLFGRDSKIPNPPIEDKEHKAITITKAYWLGSKDTPEPIRERARRPKEGEAHLYIHGEEWFPNQDHLQYKKFMSQADRNFLFRAKDHPDVKGEMQMSFWTDGPSNLREILIVIPKGESAKMAKGVAYTIHPVNSAAGIQWKVKEGVTITLERSLEEKLDALEEKLEKLEKRLQKLEKKKAGNEPRPVPARFAGSVSRNWLKERPTSKSVTEIRLLRAWRFPALWLARRTLCC